MAFGADLRRGISRLAIHGEKRVEAVSFTENGAEETLSCDAVIFNRSLAARGIASFRPWHRGRPGNARPRIDQTFRTADPRLFAAGNVLYSVRSSGPVALEGRRAARAILADLEGSRS